MAVTSPMGLARPSLETTDSWKQLTVSAFFGRCRWSNAPVAAVALSPEMPLSLGYQLTVGQFFGAVPWQGSRQAQPDPAAEPEPSLPSGLETDEMDTYELPELSEIEGGDSGDSGEITLDDFLGAFS